MKFEGKVVLIVGASSGIGRTLALRLAGEGAHVVVTARRRDKLEALVAQIAKEGGRVDCLFPFSMRWLSLCLPKRLVTRILRNDVPPLPAERVGAPRAM